jgi:hypothetical protein
MGHEMVAAWRTTPFRSAGDAMSSQDQSDGFVANLDAQFGEFPCDLEVAPVSIIWEYKQGGLQIITDVLPL